MMTDSANSNEEPGRRRLSATIRDVKNAMTDRDDVVVELREAQRMRLDLLVHELSDVIAEIPREDDWFDLAVSSGLQPRFWIDATAHVAMGRDKRTYRFLRDTRLGRTVLAESQDVKPVAAQVTRYIAERIVERERMLEGSVEPVQRTSALETAPEQAPIAEQPEPVAASAVTLTEEPAITARPGGTGYMEGLVLFLAGVLSGCAALAIWFWDKLPALGLTGQ